MQIGREVKWTSFPVDVYFVFLMDALWYLPLSNVSLKNVALLQTNKSNNNALRHSATRVGVPLHVTNRSNVNEYSQLCLCYIVWSNQNNPEFWSKPESYLNFVLDEEIGYLAPKSPRSNNNVFAHQESSRWNDQKHFPPSGNIFNFDTRRLESFRSNFFAKGLGFNLSFIASTV